MSAAASPIGLLFPSPLSTTLRLREPAETGPIGEGGSQDPTEGTGTEIAPVLVICATCHQEIAVNPTLEISFCRIHGFGSDYLFLPRTQRRFREVTFG